MTGVEKSEVKKPQKAITSLKASLHICKKEEDDVLSDFFKWLRDAHGISTTSSDENFPYCMLDHINPSSLVFY